MWKRRVANALVNLLVLVVLAEVVSLTIYFFQHGSLFYLDRTARQSVPDTQAQTLTADALHPYFGPTHRPGTPFSVPESLRLEASPNAVTNNFGFVSRYDYPYARRSDSQFIIGIFGGSVGVWFCQLGAERLVQDLKQHAFFKGKELVTLCFSHEGYKQPQQALLLTYFLSIGQPLDLVLNIDGFNEVALAPLNDQRGIDISMPSVTHIEPLINLVNQSTLTPEKLESLAAIARYKARMADLTERINRNRSAAINFVLEQYAQIVSNRYLAELFTFAGLPSNPSTSSLVYVTPKTRDRAGAAVFEDIARQWADASTLMHEMLAARSVPYFHVLQPNQYHSQRRFSADEARVALSDQSPFKDSVEQGYPLLVAQSESGIWKRHNVEFINGIHVFDNEPQPVYMDNCCHYTLTGNRLLADFIAKAILSSRWLEEP